MDYTIKDKEREFYQYLMLDLEQFETSIEDDDKSLLKQDTCDIMRLIKKNS